MPQIIYPREQRFKWYLQVDKYHKSVKETCQIFGIARKTYYKWKKHDYGLNDFHHRPVKNQPNTKLTSEVKQFIEAEKFKTNYGPKKMKMLLKKKLGLTVSTTIIYRFYQKKKLIRKPQRRLPWYQPMKQKLIVKQPGEGVQLDIKYTYEKGYREFQFSVLDPFTDKYFFKVFATKHSRNAVLAHQAAEQYFGFKILSVQTDNGSEFRGDYHDWLTRNNLTHYFIPKKSPWWNAQVERVHKTVDDEYFLNPYRVWKTIEEWLEFYNFERLHERHNGLTPEEKLQEYRFQQIFQPQTLFLPLKSVTLAC
jgi:transposase